MVDTVVVNCLLLRGAPESKFSRIHFLRKLISDGIPCSWVPTAHFPAAPSRAACVLPGEPLYIGRAYHEGTLTIGKVQPSRRCLSIPYGGEEHCYSDYEVLVVQTVNF
ncbi:hypothetical protein MRX96_005376 [Rhipicephalus microplus]